MSTSPVFKKKNDIGWPQQPLTEKVSDISKKLDFDDPFHIKGVHMWSGIGHLGPRDDQLIGSVNILVK